MILYGKKNYNTSLNKKVLENVILFRIVIIPIQDENVFNDATGLKWASSQGDLN